MQELDDWRARRVKRVNRQMLFIAAGVLAAFMLLAYRSESAEARIEMNLEQLRETRYQACLIRLDTQIQFNATRESVGRAIVALSPDAPEQAKRAMLDAMIASKQLPLPTCSR